MSVFTLASTVCGIAPNPPVLVLARIAQGCGAALMFPQTLTGIQLNFTGSGRARAIGLYAMALSSGAVLGQILGGALLSVDLGGGQWRSIFLINVPIGVAAVASALRWLPADARHRARGLDLAGIATLSAAMLLVVVPLALGRGQGWPPWTWLCLLLGVLAVAVFVAAEKRLAARGGSPLVNVSVLAGPPVFWALFTLMVATGTYYALLFTLAQYLQRGLGLGPLVSGLVLVPWVAAFGLAGQVVRRLPERARAAAPVIGCALLALAYTTISVTLATGDHDGALLTALLGVGGLGLGIQFSSLIAHLTSVVPLDYAPDISGVSTTVMQIGAAVCVAAFGTLYLAMDTGFGAGDADRPFAGTTAAFAVLALVACAAALRATGSRRTAVAVASRRSAHHPGAVGGPSRREPEDGR